MGKSISPSIYCSLEIIKQKKYIVKLLSHNAMKGNFPEFLVLKIHNIPEKKKKSTAVGTILPSDAGMSFYVCEWLFGQRETTSSPCHLGYLENGINIHCAISCSSPLPSPSQPCEHGSREVCASAQGAHKTPPITHNYITFHGRWTSHSASVFSAKWFGTNMPSLWTGTSTVH